MKTSTKQTLYNIARILTAIILLQTLYFKFSGHPESLALFTSIGMEPNGRIATGVVELITGLILLFGGCFVRLGAAMGVCLMLGAVYYHIVIIGYNSLFVMAVIALVCCLYVLWWSWKESCNINAE